MLVRRLLINCVLKSNLWHHSVLHSEATKHYLKNRKFHFSMFMILQDHEYFWLFFSKRFTQLYWMNETVTQTKSHSFPWSMGCNFWSYLLQRQILFQKYTSTWLADQYLHDIMSRKEAQEGKDKKLQQEYFKEILNIFFRFVSQHTK